MNIFEIARVAHEVNRAYCHAIGQLEAIVSALEYRIDVAASRIETIF